MRFLFSFVGILLALSLSAQPCLILAAPDNADVSRIYGGEDAKIGEFPYYAQLKKAGCGGALIARDMVLSAAHCGDQTGETVKIGAYNRKNFQGGAQKRTCTSWTINPFYLDNSHDVALCKLNEPVDIDESKVKLQINRDTSFELADKELTACGLGYLGYKDTSRDKGYPDILQRTTLRGMSDDNCKAKVNVIEPPWSVELFCADGNRKTDVCRGDSGGPLVRIETPPNSGPDIHYHIGAVSYGSPCPRANVGVYARTSAMAPWIDEVMCKENSVGKPSDCPDISDDDSEDLVCVGTQSQLVVTLTTDDYPSDTAFAIKIENANNDGWEFVRSPFRYDSKFTTYTNTLCLEANTRYQWIIIAYCLDGLECTKGRCGPFFVTLNGAEIFSSPNEDFRFRKKRIFLTPDDYPDITTPTESPTSTVTNTPAPTMGECISKKKKFRYNGCGTLSKKKCANEALCDMNNEKVCVHVCDGKKKKNDCKKTTFKGKAVCTFKK